MSAAGSVVNESHDSTMKSDYVRVDLQVVYSD